MALEVENDAHSLGLLTIGPFAIIGSIELAILQEIYKSRKTDGAKNNIRECAENLIKASADFRPKLIEYNDSRFSAATDSLMGWGYYLDGQPVFGPVYNDGPWSQNYAVLRRKNVIAGEFDRLEKAILFPLYAVVDKWKEITRRPASGLDDTELSGSPSSGHQ